MCSGTASEAEIVQGVVGLRVYVEPALMAFDPKIHRVMKHISWPHGRV